MTRKSLTSDLVYFLTTNIDPGQRRSLHRGFLSCRLRASSCEKRLSFSRLEARNSKLPQHQIKEENRVVKDEEDVGGE